MKVSFFKLGLGLIIIGSIWISFTFNESEKTQDITFLKQFDSLELNLKFTGNHIGYYKVYMPEFAGDEIFVQIRDSGDNIVQEQRIQTKMSVGYFEFKGDDVYTIKATNISKGQIQIQIEFGNTNSQKMIPAGILLLLGAFVMIIVSYVKLKNYNIAQPDENIS
ncbi:MAG: hypothetical protein ACR2LL_02690 [Nitrosopumilus sp.]|uniref:hypothetical protein n=1 Tax=Nitrosopumilus sp. TaxID=2024843 RepID=UPI00292F980D|nr:hypothetical protein [Nitrosopumilus sp.]